MSAPYDPDRPTPIPREDDESEMQAMAVLTLRDYFAAKAMPTFLAPGTAISITPDLFGREARLCYALADAMLEARQR